MMKAQNTSYTKMRIFTISTEKSDIKEKDREEFWSFNVQEECKEIPKDPMLETINL
jgi:hypothetical protein